MSTGMQHALLRRLFPLPDGYEDEGPTLEELTPRYRWWHLFYTVALLIGMFGFTWPVWLLLRALHNWNAARFEPAEVHVHDTGLAMFLPAFFLGILVTGGFLTLAMRLLLGQRFDEYVRYDNLRFGADSRRATRPIAITVLVICLVLFLAIVNYHVVFYQDKVRFQSWFGLSNSTLPYTDIVDLRRFDKVQAPNGNIINRRRYDVEFANGRVWSTDWTMGQFDDADKARLFDYLAKRSGKPVRRLPIFE